MHRLDANTSGLMVVAKSERAYSVLKQAFRDREVDKIYHALVQGHPDPLRGTVDAPIARHPSGDGRFAVVAGGRPSVTHYDTLEAFRAASLTEVLLETGRTHQIRVHMAAIRHPCVGDRLYGADPVLAARLGPDPAVAACGAPRVQPSRGRPPGRVHQRLPGRSRCTPWTCSAPRRDPPAGQRGWRAEPGLPQLAERPAPALRVERAGDRGEDLGGAAVGHPGPAGDRADVRGGGTGRGPPVGEEHRAVGAAREQPAEQLAGAVAPADPAAGTSGGAPAAQVNAARVQGQDVVGGCGRVVDDPPERVLAQRRGDPEQVGDLPAR